MTFVYHTLSLIFFVGITACTLKWRALNFIVSCSVTVKQMPNVTVHNHTVCHGINYTSCSCSKIIISFFSQEENNSSTVITSFATAYIAPVKVLVQTAGELDFETIFNHSPLLYPVLSYILFVLFIIAMPVLFNNFLVSLDQVNSHSMCLSCKYY